MCLLAMVLLLTPFLLPAMTPSGMACCADGMCSAVQHEHHGQQERHGNGMECAGHSAAMGCAMSCCQPEKSSILPAPLLYVLTETATLAVQNYTVAVEAVALPSAPTFAFEPKSPPPRLLS